MTPVERVIQGAERDGLVRPVRPEDMKPGTIQPERIAQPVEPPEPQSMWEVIHDVLKHIKDYHGSGFIPLTPEQELYCMSNPGSCYVPPPVCI